jgi:hypothetical protein
MLSIGTMVVAVYKLSPYHAATTLVFTVDVLSEVGWARFVNITFSLEKFRPIVKDGAWATKIGRLSATEPKAVFLMQLNMTLEIGNTRVIMKPETVSFPNEGQYQVVVSHLFDGLYTGTYLVIISYSSRFNERALTWYSRELYLTVY